MKEFCRVARRPTADTKRLWVPARSPTSRPVVDMEQF